MIRSEHDVVLIDGGDLACGELLMLVHRRVRDGSAGTVVSIATTDPAAPIDIPAWCHLTGHRYLGPAAGAASRFDIELVRAPNAVDPVNPWRPTASPQPTSEHPGVHP